MRAYFFSLIVLCIVLVMDIIGLNGLYVSFPPYDIFMHILGGIGIGLALCAAVRLHGSKIIHKYRVIIIGVLFVGIIWELFEMYYDITGEPLWSTPYYIDTAKDLIDDIIGGGIAVYLCLRNLK
ncbi:MAG: hypothetical protein AAB777_02665 [Patescibacteria group bacterium]